MRKNYRFAGLEISVCIPDEKIYENEYRLTPFSIEKVNEPEEFFFELREQLEEPSGICVTENSNFCLYQDGNKRIRYVGAVEFSLDGAYIRTCSEGKRHEVQLLANKFPSQIGTKTVLNAMDVQHLLAQIQGVILHCSYIEYEGKAILFTAPSETGKSTQAELWKNLRDADIINGDRAALRLVEGKILAEGIPFAGSSTYCKNRSLEVTAIIYLGQAAKTSIERLKGYQAFSRIWEGVSLDMKNRSDVEKVSELISKTAESVPVYYLQCAPDETAVIALENVLKEMETA